MNMAEQVSVGQNVQSFVQMPKSGITVYYGVYFCFCEFSTLISSGLDQFAIPPTANEGSLSPYPLQHLLSGFFFVILTWVKMKSQNYLDLHFSNCLGQWTFLRFYLVIFIYSFEKPIQIYSLLFEWVICFID